MPPSGKKSKLIFVFASINCHKSYSPTAAMQMLFSLRCSAGEGACVPGDLQLRAEDGVGSVAAADNELSVLN